MLSFILESIFHFYFTFYHFLTPICDWTYVADEQYLTSISGAPCADITVCIGGNWISGPPRTLVPERHETAVDVGSVLGGSS